MTTAGEHSPIFAGPQGLTERFEVTAIERDRIAPTYAEVCVEDSVRLLLNGARVATLTATPDELLPLAYGHLVTEGLIKAPAEIREVRLNGTDVEIFVERLRPEEEMLTEVRSHGFAGGRSSRFDPANPGPSRLKLDLPTIFACVGTHNDLAELWRRTGGTHCSAIFDACGGLVSYAEDLGRHNTVDKAVGKALLDGRDLSECFLVTTGRVPAGMVAKVYRAGMPMLISNMAPLSTGVELARRLNVTLAGCARPPRMFIYSGSERIHYAPE